jgi:hypothetical protein
MFEMENFDGGDPKPVNQGIHFFGRQKNLNVG